MALTIPAERLVVALNGDPEFRIASRYWDGALELRIGDESCSLTLTQGEVTAASSDRGDDLAPRRVIVSAPVGDWAKLLQDPPPPFYHDFWPASFRHDFHLSGDDDYLWAYFPAIRRTAEVLRQVMAEGGR